MQGDLSSSVFCRLSHWAMVFKTNSLFFFLWNHSVRASSYTVDHDGPHLTHRSEFSVTPSEPCIALATPRILAWVGNECLLPSILLRFDCRRRRIWIILRIFRSRIFRCVFLVFLVRFIALLVLRVRARRVCWCFLMFGGYWLGSCSFRPFPADTDRVLPLR